MSFVDAAGDRPRTPAALPEELGFGRYFTERMFVQRHDAQRGWHEGD